MERDGDERRAPADGASSERNARARLVGDAGRAAGGYHALARAVAAKQLADANAAAPAPATGRMLVVEMPRSASSLAPRHDAAIALAERAHAAGVDRALNGTRLVAATIVDDRISLWLDIGRTWTDGPLSAGTKRLVETLGASMRLPTAADERDSGSLDDLMRSRTDQLRRIDRSTPIRWEKALRVGFKAHGLVALAGGAAHLLDHVPWREVTPWFAVALPIDLVVLPLAIGSASRAICAWRRRAYKRSLHRTVPGHETARPRTAAPRTTPDDARIAVDGDAPWAVLRRLAPDRIERVAGARRTCLDLLNLAADHGDPDGIDAVVMVERHLPRLVAEGAALADAARPAERAAVVERLLALVDGIADDAERARDGLLQRERDRFATTSAFVEARVSPSILSTGDPA